MNDPKCIHIMGYMDTEVGDILIRFEQWPEYHGVMRDFNYCPLCGAELSDFHED